MLGIVPNQHCHASHICHYTFSSSHIKKKKYGEISLNNSLFSPVCPKYCHFNMSIYCLRHQAFYTYSTSQLRQTSFLVLSNHMWLRATVMDTAGLSHHSGLSSAEEASGAAFFYVSFCEVSASGSCGESKLNIYLYAPFSSEKMSSGVPFSSDSL